MFDTHSIHLDHALVTRGDRGYVGQILKNIFKLYFVVQNLTNFPFFGTNIIGNFLPSSYLFSEFIYFNPVFNYKFLNDHTSQVPLFVVRERGPGLLNFFLFFSYNEVTYLKNWDSHCIENLISFSLVIQNSWKKTSTMKKFVWNKKSLHKDHFLSDSALLGWSKHVPNSPQMEMSRKTRHVDTLDFLFLLISCPFRSPGQ